MSGIKSLISFALALLLTLASIPAFAFVAADYNAHDVEKLTAFFEQTDAAGVKNGEKLFENYLPNDPSTWAGLAELDQIADFQDIVLWNEDGSLRRLCVSNRGLCGPLDLAGCESLVAVSCWANSITSLELSGCASLNYVRANNNLLENVLVSGLERLIQLSLNKNRLTELDISGCTGLSLLRVSDNLLTELDLSGHPWLESISCSRNRLTSLRIPAECHEFHGIYCEGNELTELIIEQDFCEEIVCSDNPFTELDISGTGTGYFKCLGCPLSELRFSARGHTIALHSGGNGTVGAMVGERQGEYGPIPSIIAVAAPDEGYALDAWYDENGDWAYFYNESEIYSEDMGDISITAVFEQGEEPFHPEPAYAVWDGSLAEEFAGGRGTEAEPYLISNGAELYLLSMLANRYGCAGMYFELTDDIYLNSIEDFDNWTISDYRPDRAWTPIGQNNGFMSCAFSGSFNGRGHTVYGLYNTCDNGARDYFGLFGRVKDAAIKNVKVCRSAIYEEHYSGLIVGIAEDSVIESCGAEGLVSCQFQGYYCGGVVGRAANTTVSGCAFTGTVEGHHSQCIGGIVGCFVGEEALLEGCVNSGSINAVGGSYAGGVAGRADNIRSCRNLGSVTADGTDSVGGVAGETGISAADCANDGAISCGGCLYVGGITGCARGGVSCCVNRGAISGEDAEQAGGIAGVSQADIADCFNTGDIAAKTCAGIAWDIGGCTVSRCYNTGAVSAAYVCDAIAVYAGSSSGCAEGVQHCYCLEGCCGAEYSGAAALTDGQLRSAESYEGFDFDSVWTMEGSASYPYAELRSIFAIELIPGDVDENGSLTANDALLVLRSALGLISGIDDAAADVDGDGSVTANDALMILRAALGIAAL